MKILLAEDDANIATIAKMALEHVGGHEVQHVTDGELALKATETNKYDLILLDEMMPKMSGHKVCEAYTKSKYFSGPVIIMSANPQSLELIKRIGASGSISKPFDPMTLNTQIEDILQGPKSEAV